jgi:hypothetical protein
MLRSFFFYYHYFCSLHVIAHYLLPYELAFLTLLVRAKWPVFTKQVALDIFLVLLSEIHYRELSPGLESQGAVLMDFFSLKDPKQLNLYRPKNSDDAGIRVQPLSCNHFRMQGCKGKQIRCCRFFVWFLGR